MIGGFLSEFFIYLNDDHDFNCKLLLTSLSDDPKRLGDLIYRKDVQYYSRDLTNDSWFFNEIDFCIYCAGYAQPNKFLSDAEKTYKLNVDAMVRTFQSVMVERKKSKMLFISSSEVYALNDTTKPHCETDELKLDLWHKKSSLHNR